MEEAAVLEKEAKEERLREERLREREERMRRAAEYDDSAFQDLDEGQVVGEKEEEDSAEVPAASHSGSNFYCVVCSKKFKSEKQLRNHEKSKKHLHVLEEMRRFLEEEER